MMSWFDSPCRENWASGSKPTSDKWHDFSIYNNIFIVADTALPCFYTFLFRRPRGEKYRKNCVWDPGSSTKDSARIYTPPQGSTRLSQRRAHMPSGRASFIATYRLLNFVTATRLTASFSALTHTNICTCTCSYIPQTHNLLTMGSLPLAQKMLSILLVMIQGFLYIHCWGSR